MRSRIGTFTTSTPVDQPAHGKAGDETRDMWSIADLHQGDHIAHLYRSEEERWEILAAFLRSGLERGEKAIYAAGNCSTDDVLLHLQEVGFDPRSSIRSGQMVILPHSRFYEREGGFTPEATVHFLTTETARAMQEGFSGLRVASEMEWVPEGEEELERMLEYEAHKDFFLTHHPCLSFCQFDVGRFPPEVLLTVLRSHPLLIVGQETYRNFYYVSSYKLKASDRATVQLHHWLEHLRQYKEIAEALRRSEERYALAQRAAGITSWEWNIRAGTVFWSEVPVHRFGLNEKEKTIPAGQMKAREIFQPLWGLLHPDDRSNMLKTLREVLREGHLWSAEHRIVRQDGTIRWVAETGTVMRNAEGQPIRMIGIVRDVTEEKRAAEVLRRHAREQEALYTIAAASSASLDSDEFLPVVLDTLLPVLEAHAGWILLAGPSLNAPPRIVAWRGVPDELVTQMQPLPLRECVRLSSAAESAPDLISSGQCARLPPDLSEEIGLQSYACAALQAEGEVLGFLTVAWREPRALSEANRTMLMAVGHQVGTALRNITLYRSARQVDRLRAVQAIATTITSSLDLDIVLRRLLWATCRSLGADGGGVLLFEEETGAPEFALGMMGGEFIQGGHIPLLQDEVINWALQHTEALRINDVHQDPRITADLIDRLEGWGVRSLVYAPIEYRGKIVGVLAAVSKRRKAFDDRDLDLLEAVSPVAAVAVENARLYTSARDRVRELRVLNRVGLVLTATLDYEKVVRSALHQIRDLFSADGVALLQVDEKGTVHFIRAVSGEEEIETQARLSSGEGIAGWVVANRQPVLLEDARSDPRWKHPTKYHRPYQSRALMAVPLIVSGRVIGVVEVSCGERGVYTRDDLRVLKTLAPTLAVALENARLYEEQKQLLEERERTRAWMIHSEKIAALGKMAASIAHEINNPLQAIQGCITLLREELEGEHREEKLEQYLSMAESEIARLSSVVRRVRDFYRPAREERRLTNLHAVLEAVLELTHKQLRQSGVVVRQEWATHLPAIQANPDYLRHLFLNLILNAADAMPEGGTLCIRTSLESMESSGEEGEKPAIRIDFIDTGTGMSPEVLEHIFEPFFTTKADGSGLGLSISREIVQAHGGRIAVESREGEGTTFSIWLPVEPLADLPALLRGDERS